MNSPFFNPSFVGRFASASLLSSRVEITISSTAPQHHEADTLGQRRSASPQREHGDSVERASSWRRRCVTQAEAARRFGVRRVQPCRISDGVPRQGTARGWVAVPLKDQETCVEMVRFVVWSRAVASAGSCRPVAGTVRSRTPERA